MPSGLAAAVLIFVHSLIPHKEYRFVEPAFYIIAITAGFGSVELFRESLPQRWLAWVLIMFWIATSGSLAFTGDFLKKWWRKSDYLQAELYLHADPDLCGVLMFDHAARSGGYAYLHRNVPIYWDYYQSESDKKYATSYNVVFADEDKVATFEPEFHKERCFRTDYDNTCVLKRAGGCVADPHFPSILEQSRFGEKLPPRPSDAKLGK